MQDREFHGHWARGWYFRTPVTGNMVHCYFSWPFFRLVIWLVAMGWATSSLAEEPVDRFLAALRERSMFSMASAYLDQQAKAGLLTPEMLADLPLERIILLKDSLAGSRNREEYAKRAEEVVGSLDSFLKESPKHPRRPEARLLMANLLLSRGQDLVKKKQGKEPSDDDRTRARTSFQSASEIFEGTLQELRPVLESMAGNRVSSEDASKLALRERLQQEYRQAEIMSALTSRFIAETQLQGSAEFKNWLDKSEKQFSEIIKKTPGAKNAGPHTLCLLYRGQVQSMLGKVEEAADSLSRVADIMEGGVFREWRVKATTGLLELLCKPPHNKYEAIVPRAVPLLKEMQPNERLLPHFVDLQLALANAQIEWATLLESQDNGATRARAERRLARETLQGLVRRPGDHQEPARKMLARLGVDTPEESESKLPAFKNFAEGFAESRKRLEQLEELEVARDIAKQNNAEGVESIEREIATRVEQARLILTKSLGMVGRDDRGDLTKARYYYAFVLSKSQLYWESAALADFLSRTGAGTDQGLAASSLALFNYSKLYESGDGQRKEGLLAPMESLSRFMIEHWPNTKGSEDAALTLIHMAQANQNWDEAERFMELLPPDSPKAAAARLDLGFIQWNRYLLALEERRKAAEGETAEDVALRDRSEKLLIAGANSLKPENINQRAVEGANALTSIYLRTQRIKDAEDLQNKPEIGPLAVVRSSPTNAIDPAIKLQTLRLHLQARVMEASQNTSQGLDPAYIEKVVREMEQVAQENADGKDKLSRALVFLAQELRSQFQSGGDLTKQARLADTVLLLLRQIASVSTNPSMLESAAATMLELGEELVKHEQTKPQATSLMSESSRTFNRLIELASAETNEAAALSARLPNIKLQAAKAARGQAAFEQAVTMLLDLLTTNNNNLTAQQEAAKTLQAWGEASKNSKYFVQAMTGIERAKNGENKVWGWGGLARKLSSQLGKDPSLKDHFFDARWELAQCRYATAKYTKDAAQRKKLLEAALGDVRATYISYPELGSQTSRERFDNFTRLLQRELGKPQIGLKEFK